VRSGHTLAGKGNQWWATHSSLALSFELELSLLLLELSWLFVSDGSKTGALLDPVWYSHEYKRESTARP
jgi:hypothetical protein